MSFDLQHTLERIEDKMEGKLDAILDEVGGLRSEVSGLKIRVAVVEDRQRNMFKIMGATLGTVFTAFVAWVISKIA